MKIPHQELLEKLYRSFNAGDLDSVMEGMTEDVNFPHPLKKTRLVGKETIRRVWQADFDLLDFNFEILGVSKDLEGRAVFKVHQVTKDRSGRILVDRVTQHIFTLRDGKIARMDRNPL